MLKDKTPATARLAVLDYKRYASTFLPNIEAAHADPSGSKDAMEALKLLIANVKDRDQREDALTQFGRLDGATKNGRWQPAATGLMLEFACSSDEKVVEDLIPTMPLWIDILYDDWEEHHAIAVQEFFAYLPNHTIHWASTPDFWRAVVGPEKLEAVGTAMGALTPRQFQKKLTGAESGDVFDNEEAERISAWWGEVRSVVRAARREEAGILITIAEPK